MVTVEMVSDVLNKASKYTDPILRDFTSSAEERLISIANDVEDSDSWWERHIYDPLGRWLDKNGLLYLLKNTIDYQKELINCYNYNLEVIKKIFSEARSCDSRYGSRISQYQLQAEKGVLILQELAECLDISIPKHEVTVYNRLQYFTANWVEKSNGESVSIDELKGELDGCYRQNQEHEYTNTEIEMFCNQKNAEDVFRDYSDYIYVDELNYGGLEATGMVIFLGEKITKDQVTSIFTGEGYSEKAARENLSAIIDSVISSDSKTADFISDHELAKDIILKFIDCKEKNDKKRFEELYPNYSYTRFEKFIQMMGGIDVVKKMAETYPEMVDYLFNDYSDGLDILNSLEYLCGGNISPEMQHAIDTLQRDYDNKWKGILKKLWDETIDFGYDQRTSALKKWIGEKFPAYGVLKSLLDITGGEKKVEAYCKLLSLQNISNDTQAAFEKAVEKIQTGVFTEDTENVLPGQYTEEDLKTVENLFNVLKETNITIYKTYRDMCVDDPMRQVYANEQIERLNRVTLNNFDKYPREPYYF